MLVSEGGAPEEGAIEEVVEDVTQIDTISDSTKHDKELQEEEDKHPEKRMKAAYAKFEESRLKELR